VAANVAVYERLIPGLDSFGPAAREAIADTDLIAEVTGIAAGADVPIDALLAMQARTELLGGAECSVIAGPGVVSQNWDWHPDVVPLIWIVEQPGGRWFATLTEAGMLGKIGLSSAGLCVGLNFLRCSLDGGIGGVPVHVLLRMLLDRVDDLDAALALLTSATVSASSCITLGSRGAPVAVELSPGGSRVVRGDRLLHTNHFLAGPPAGEDLEAADEPSTLVRLAELERSSSLAAHPVCRHETGGVPWADRLATLASLVMEPSVPRLQVADGPPCERPLEEVPLP
jgi:isopenicillin-N N-acyltransferase-like protein